MCGFDFYASSQNVIFVLNNDFFWGISKPDLTSSQFICYLEVKSAECIEVAKNKFRFYIILPPKPKSQLWDK